MITCRFDGGLGNNLFQLATLIGYAEKNNLDFCIPLYRTLYDKTNKNKQIELDNIFDYKFKYEQIQLPIYVNKDIYPTPEHLRNFRYQTISDVGNICLYGYFQSEKYFKHVEKQLKQKYFKFKDEHFEYVKTKYKNIFNKKIVGLHFRKYQLEDQQNHPITPIEFYENIVKLLPQNVNYMIFSDNISWCKNNIKFLKDPIFIEESIAIDLLLMTICNYLIISNSTFGWWGAWLNDKKDKKIIVPKTWWFGPALKHLNIEDLFPDEWIKI
jgi:hypothetical protein